jgi:hypothetical protein
MNCASYVPAEINKKALMYLIIRAVSLILWLTHLGSNQDSAEPKSVVLPITPWVNKPLKVLQN